MYTMIIIILKFVDVEIFLGLLIIDRGESVRCKEILYILSSRYIFMPLLSSQLGL